MGFRNGQWVLFKAEPVIPGAHLTNDGRHVGIYQRGGVDATGQPSVDRVMVCAPDGQNLPVLLGGTAVNLSLPPALCSDLQPLLEKRHIPAARRAVQDPNFKPRP